MILSQDDYNALLASMSKIPKPNKTFREAMKKHKQLNIPLMMPADFV